MNCSCTFCTEAEKIVFVPTKVESLTGVAIKMVGLGSEHSLAVTGLILMYFLPSDGFSCFGYTTFCSLYAKEPIS